MAYNRDGHAVTVLDGMIYAIGLYHVYLYSIVATKTSARKYSPRTL